VPIGFIETHCADRFPLILAPHCGLKIDNRSLGGLRFGVFGGRCFTLESRNDDRYRYSDIGFKCR